MKDLKDYYEILGLKEGASSEQVTARWRELKREIQSNPKVGETFKSIREVTEAYEMLKACAPSFVEFDMHRFQKEAPASRKAKKEKEKKEDNYFFQYTGHLSHYRRIHFHFRKTSGDHSACVDNPGRSGPKNS